MRLLLKFIWNFPVVGREHGFNSMKIPRHFSSIGIQRKWHRNSMDILPNFYRNSEDLSHFYAWWRHQMETFSALLAICAGNSPGPGEFPAQRPVMRSFDVFFDLRLNQQLSKQSWGWWFEASSRSLWRHCNGNLCGSTTDSISEGIPLNSCRHSKFRGNDRIRNLMEIM